MNRERQSNVFQLKWRNLYLIQPKQDKYLLRNCGGEIRSGQFLSIMGPSGAGKSSLLSIITARLHPKNTKLNLTGSILINNTPVNLNDFSRVSAYVQQDDLLFGTLTVRETFMFQARLKLWKLTPQEQQDRCEQILGKLNLRQCGNVLVGNSQFKKSISGGQKKRVSIGVQLIANPAILVFDEPTSGLDSHNALIIIKLLSKLAKQDKKLIITTIHQPSTLMFQKMDRLYLLKLGQCIYDGPAKEIVKYMQNLKIAVDYRMNPADFFMLQISAMKEHQGYKSPLNPYNYQRKNKILVKNNSTEYQNSIFIGSAKGQTVPFRYQFKTLFERALRNFYRLPSNQLNKLVTAVMIPALLGILFYQIGQNVPAKFQQRYFSDLISFLFMGPFCVFAMNIYDTTLIFPAQKQLVSREAGANLYSLTAYYISRLLAEFAGCIIPALICSLVIYLTSKLQLSFLHLSLFIGIHLLIALEGYFFGLFFGVMCKNQISAINLLPMAVIPMLLFGGIVVKIDDIPGYVRWLQYLSPIRHAFLIVFQDQMNTSNFEQYTPLNLPKVYGIDADPIIGVLCSIGLIMLYFSLSIAILHCSIKKKM